jgi:cytochrome P450
MTAYLSLSRRYAVASLIVRELDRGLTFGPYAVHKGASILIPIASVHLNPRVWKQPLVRS